MIAEEAKADEFHSLILFCPTKIFFDPKNKKGDWGGVGSVTIL